MKKAWYTLLLSLTVACSQPDKRVTVGALTLPATPHTGEPIALQYDIDSTRALEKDNFQITLYYTVGSTIYARAIATADTANPFKATFTLPDSAQSFALKFWQHNHVVNRNNGYVSAVYDPLGRPVAGAWAGMSLFENEIGFNRIGSGLLSRPADLDTALQWMQKDFAAHPAIKDQWRDTYFHTLLAVKEQAAYPEIRSALATLLSVDSVPEKTYGTAYKAYIEMNMWQQADSVMKIAARKFPDGRMAMEAAESQFRFQGAVDHLIAYYKDFKQKFPANEPYSLSSTLQDKMLALIAYRYLDQKDYQKWLSYLAKVKDQVYRADRYASGAGVLAKTNENLPLADSVSRLALKLLRNTMNRAEQHKETYQTVEDWHEELQKKIADYSDAYATLLRKEGKAKKALVYQKQAVDLVGVEDRGIYARYIQYLMEAQAYLPLQKLLEKIIIEGKSNNKFDSYLKPTYVQLNHSEKGYADYYHQIEKKANAKLNQRLAKSEVDIPVPDLRLPDLNGKWVALADMKGKTVILDFWSTWCHPCKASMPGMQQVVDQYKSDTNVVFFFIDTWEKLAPGQRRQEVAKFVAQNNYSFHVLLDQRQKEDTTQYQAVSRFGIQGIPTKFVIGPEGRIHYKKLGFWGSTTAEVKAVSRMIDNVSSSS